MTFFREVLHGHHKIPSNLRAMGYSRRKPCCSKHEEGALTFALGLKTSLHATLS